MQGNSIIRKVLRVLRAVVGQKSFYRISRLLMYEARFDVMNDPANNGEPYLQRLVLHAVSNPVVFDVGANVGDWTAMLLTNAGRDITVHAFEPCAGTYEILKRRQFPSVLL